MVSQKYRWDFIGLSTDEKPTSETSDKVVNGSTYYCSDTSKLYVYCDGTWYERKPLGGGGGGGTSDFNDLSNRPKYNGSDMTGSTNIPEVKTYTAGSNVAISDQNVISATDTTYSNFTGTDGTAAGTAGLVPAPTTTDAGKFLKADGTWDSAGGGSGGITELTSADYDYPDDSPDGVALWRLDSGWYTAPGITVFFDVAKAYGTFSNGGELFYVSKFPTADVSRIAVIGKDNTVTVYSTQLNSGSEYSSPTKTVSVVQSTGTSTTDVMSQNAVTSMVFADPSIREAVRIGNTKTVNAGSVGIGRITGSQYTGASGNYSIAIGSDASAGTNGAVSIGREADVRGIARGAIALGAYSKATSAGEMNIGSSDTSYGYNNSNYRLLTGLYDPQNAHDATNKEYVDPTTDSSAPTTATVGRLGQIFIDTTNADAYMCVAVDTVTPAYTWKQITA